MASAEPSLPKKTFYPTSVLSLSVRKPMVPNSRSQAGALQMVAPTPIYVRSSRGALGISRPASAVAGSVYAAVGAVRNSGALRKVLSCANIAQP